MWVTCTNVLKDAEGAKRQPRGFKPVQGLAMALYTRTKFLYGMHEAEHAGGWRHATSEAVKIALEDVRYANSAEVTEFHSSDTPATTSRPQSRVAEKRLRNDVTDSFPGVVPLIMNFVKLEVEAFKTKRKSSMFKMDKEEKMFFDPPA